MWKNVKDMVEDLSKLNDFGVPGDEEPYQMFYSNKVCSKSPSPVEPEPFLDPRTGEVLPPCDKETEYSGNSRRGCQNPRNQELWADLELQSQLKQIRKMRPSDREIELHYTPKSSPEITILPSTSTNSNSKKQTSCGNEQL